MSIFDKLFFDKLANIDTGPGFSPLKAAEEMGLPFPEELRKKAAAMTETDVAAYTASRLTESCQELFTILEKTIRFLPEEGKIAAKLALAGSMATAMTLACLTEVAMSPGSKCREQRDAREAAAAAADKDKKD